MNSTELQAIIQCTVAETLKQLGHAEETISHAEAKRIYKTRLKDFEDNNLVRPILIGVKRRYKITELIFASKSNYKLNQFLIK